MLELIRVTKRFGGGRPVLADISFRAAPGEIVALIGGSGTGKSTALRLIAGLEAPDQGEVRINGRRVAGPDASIGFVFQEPRLMPWLNVAENVGFGLRHVPRTERAERVAAALARVGLGEAARRLPRELSGGMAQRAALARALVARPSLLLLDEPFSALDALLRADLQAHLVELWREERPTMVLVTHDIEEAVLVADRVLVLQGGPGRIAGEFKVELPRPRDKFEPGIAALADRLLAALDRATPRRVPGEVAHPAAAI